MARKTPLDGEIEFLKPSELSDLLEMSILARRAVFVHGDPGLGKSEIIRQTVGRIKRKLFETRLTGRDLVDLYGLPAVDGAYTHWLRPKFLPEGTDPCVWFLDETNRNTQQMLNLILQPVLDGRMGDHELPKDCVVIAAGNFEDDPGVVKMSAAMALRFKHVGIVADVDDWCVWARASGIYPSVLAFMRWRPELLHQFDPKKKASPNPRTWKFTSDDVATCEAQKASPRLLQAAVVGNVGKAAGTEYMGFHRMFTTLPSVDAAIMNPKTAALPDAANPSVCYATSAALARRASPSNFNRIVTYASRMNEEFNRLTVHLAVARERDHPSMPEHLPAGALTTQPEYLNWVIAHPEVVN